MAHGGTSRWRVGDGEEARLTPGAAADAEVWSRGFLPLRVRSEGSYRLRPAFPGTAVVLGDETYEVLVRNRAARGRPRRLSPARMARGRGRPRPRRLRLGLRSRGGGRAGARARPRAGRGRGASCSTRSSACCPRRSRCALCDRLGLYAVTATLVSGLVESLGVILLVPVLLARGQRAGPAPSCCSSRLPRPSSCWCCPASVARSAPSSCARPAARRPSSSRSRRCGRSASLRERRDRSFVPLTRAAFWERLAPPGRGGAATRRLARLPRPAAAPQWGGARRLFVGRRLLERRPGAARARPGPARPLVPPRAARRAPRRPASRRSPRRPPDAYAEEVLAAGAPRVGRAQRGLRVAHAACSPPTSRRAPSTTAAGPAPRVARRSPRRRPQASSGLTC